jgi:8-oxo-dGTP pyrophosphatase MutT (NUDIX family)
MRREAADLAATALREANEELGLARDHIQLLAALPMVETQTTGVPDRPVPGPARGGSRGGPSLPDLAGAAEGSAVAGRPSRGVGVTYRILEPLIPRLLADEWPL